MNKLFTFKGGNLKFQVQDSDLEYMFSWRLKNLPHFLGKKPSSVCQLLDRVSKKRKMRLPEIQIENGVSLVANDRRTKYKSEWPSLSLLMIESSDLVANDRQTG